MAHELSVATQELAQATRQLASAREPTSSWAWLRRRLGRARARVLKTVRGVEPAAAPPEEWSERDMFLMDDRYRQWVDLYDTISDGIRQALASKLGELVDPPLVSIIFPVYNTSEAFLRQAIDSVRSQIYTNWELCISDDCSTLDYVGTVLAEYAAADARIKVKRRGSNGHISASSNTAVAMADGTWLCLMDHDDVLAEHTLAVAVLAIADQDDPGILYSDEDHIDSDGQRSAPYFKPDFDPLLILGQNYFSHLCMIRKDLVDAVGGFREGYEGSQDWDLVLRVIEKLRPAQILHVPHVLYHWRAHCGVDRVEPVCQAICDRGLPQGGTGTSRPNRYRRAGLDDLGEQLQSRQVEPVRGSAPGQRDRPTPQRSATATLHREHPRRVDVPEDGDPGPRRWRIPPSDATVPARSS